MVLPNRALAAEAPSPPADSAVVSGASDNNYEISFTGVAQGLPHNTVNAILQTRDGYLWVGTAAGLARFDGLVFSVPGDEQAPGLKQAYITSLLEDGQGGLWVGTQGNGVVRLRAGAPAWFTTAEGLADGSVTSLAQDAVGRVWIGTQGGLNRWENGQLARFTSPVVPAGDGIVALHAGRSGTLWVTTRLGVYRVQDGRATPFESADLPQGRNADLIGAYEDRSGNVWAFGATFLLNLTQGRRFNYFRSLDLASSRVWTICEQSDGAFWIGTSGRGLFRFRNGRFEATGAREGLDQCDVRALYGDRLGNLWIGTSDNGLARLHTRRHRFISVNEGLNSHKVTTVAADGAGRLFVGTADAGLLRWDGRQMEPLGNSRPLDRATQIQSLCVDQRGALWVGTCGLGLIEVAEGRQRRFGTSDGLGSDVVLALAAEPGGDGVWVGTQAGTLHRLRAGAIESFTEAEGLTGSPILCLLSRPGGSLFIGSETGGLVVWDGKHLAPVAGPPELTNKPVRCLFEDRNGRLWAGTWGAGAFCRNGSTWKALSTRQGLGSDAIGQIMQDDVGDFWFGTDENLCKIPSAQMESLLEGGRETVAGVSVLAGGALDNLKCPLGWPGVARGTNGVWWLATASGLLPLSPREQLVAEPPPPVILEVVLVNGQPRQVAHGQSLRLGPGARSLDFAFTAISFTAPLKLRFRHKLENFDVDWVTADAGRRAHYGPLPPGRYRFRVIAASPDGVWDEAGASLPLVVVPPVWRAWWFLTLCGVVVAGAIWAVARYNAARRWQAELRAAEQRHAMDRERARIAQDMHDEIGSKLTRISFLSEVARQGAAEPEAAGKVPPVEAIATTSRELLQALDEIVWAVNPRNDNLEQLAGYLEQHAREYFQATALECELQVPSRLPHVPLSAEVRHNVFLAFEEALNNALKHSQAGRVRIIMNVEPDSFQIELKDDGKGFAVADAGQPGQDGLRNLQTRLRAVGGSCQILSRPGGGTQVILRFPLSPAGTAAQQP